MNKRALQIAMAILGIIPIGTGIVGLFGLSDPIFANSGLPANAILDSNLRFFAGVWLGLGIALYWLIPNIERETTLFRVLWGMIFIGGIGRLLSMFFLALPPIPFIGFTALEIIGAPFFIWWQAQLARQAAPTPSGETSCAAKCSPELTLMPDKGWHRAFDDPSPLPKSGHLRTLHNAR